MSRRSQESWGDTDEGLGAETKELIRLKSTTDMTQAEMAIALNRSERSIANKLNDLRKLAKETGQDFGTELEPHQKLEPPKGTADKVNIDEKTNIIVAESKGPRIQTLAQLIEVCKIDLDVWVIERHVVNKWEVGAKFGPKGYEKLVVEPLYQVKAWMVRKRPIPVDPVVSPVRLTVVPPPPVPKTTMPLGLKRGMAFPDPQFGFRKSLRTSKLEPFHDRAALDIALQIAQDYELEFEAWLGDFMDLADWSDKYTREPNFFWTTQPAAIEGKWWLTQFRLADPTARIKLIEGNHEARMPTQLLKHLKEAYGIRSVDALELPPLMSIPRILALHELDIEWIDDYPNGEAWVNDYVVCEHGPIARAKSGSTVTAMVPDANETRIIGHAHRIECATRTIHERDQVRTASVWSIGCLCRIDGTVPAKKAKVNWQQAVAMIEYFLDGKPEHTVTPIPINNGKAIYNGKMYVARDRLEEIRESTYEMYENGIGWNF